MEQGTHELVIHTDSKTFVSTPGTEGKITRRSDAAAEYLGTSGWLRISTPDGFVRIARRSVVAIEVRATDYLDT